MFHCRRRIRISLIGWLPLLWALSGATAPPDLYQATVPLRENGVEGRNAAVRQAMEKVLVKVTGSRGVARREAAQAVIQEAPGLVQQYRYDSQPQTPGAAGERRLVVRFDPDALVQALRRHALPAWGANRPGVLLWLGLEEGGRRRFYQPEQDVQLTAAVAGVERERGLEFLYPLLDLEDLAHIRPQDLWGGFEAPLREASARYGADLVLSGRVLGSRAAQRVEWQLLDPRGSERWESRGAPGTAVASGLQEAVDRIAARYAPVAGGGTQGVLVLVRGIIDFAAFQRVDGFLRDMDGVERVETVRVDPERVLFRVNIRGGSDAVRRAASLGGVLDGEVAPAPGAAVDTLIPDLSFRMTE